MSNKTAFAWLGGNVRFTSATFTVATFLVSAGGAMAATTTCSTVAACVMGTNTSAGYGVEGTSKSNDGLVGITTQNATSPSTGKAGVAGYDRSTNGMTYNSGVYGTSKNGYGVEGKVSGLDASGVYGLNTSGSGSGVFGYAYGTSSDPHLSLGSGVTGQAVNGFGVSGYADDGFGLLGSASIGTALYLLLEGDGSTGRPLGYFLQADYEAMSPYTAVSIDASGNEVLHGTLTFAGSSSVRTKSATGKDLTSYGARTSSPTMEDFGQSSLRQGAAHIVLEPAYSSTIDPRSYMVFITPQGDSRGLYTTAITQTGFDVRENGNGRSSVAFFYRIVGHPLDTKAQRLPLMRTSTLHVLPNVARRKPAIGNR